MKLNETPAEEPKQTDTAKAKKIENIILVMQSNPSTCGQACIAMLANADINEVIGVMRTSGSTSIGQLIEALDYYNIKHAPRNMRISKKNPNISEICILTVHMPEYTHWIVHYKGKYYDPEFGLSEECHSSGKITSFLEIYS